MPSEGCGVGGGGGWGKTREIFLPLPASKRARLLCYVPGLVCSLYGVRARGLGIRTDGEFDIVKYQDCWPQASGIALRLSSVMNYAVNE